ncbi:regulatory protein RecX [Desulfosporosinus acididurans]|uniref:regulatory protein RecX n=1 Tax=Desulfosporosinus acididurans TaxID=476652 RepID=UPI0006498CF4|nr:regulatory protein RecX [Desulfosporosinus acididurans]
MILLRNNQSPKSAWEAALDSLSRRALTKRELETRLNDKGYESSQIQSVIDKLLGYGYLNDRELALTYAKSRLHRYSRRRVTMDMRNRGIASDLIEQVLEEVYSWDEEAKLCLALAQKWRVQEEQRWEEKALKDSEKKTVPQELWVQQRVVRKLIQRGYPSDIVQNVLAKMRIE